MAFKRVLLKLSGEQLAGQHDFGIDPEFARYLAAELAQAQQLGVEIVLIIGGGNMVRGAKLASTSGIKRVTADQMGMLSGLMNAMALTDIFEHEGLTTRCLSNVYVEQFVENYSFRLAEKHLQNGRILLVAGGSGRPYTTHDIAAVMVGLELGCDIVMKGTKVDGVYSKDPSKYADATRYGELGFQEALENPAIAVMDKAAMGMAMEHNMPIMIFELGKPGNIRDLVAGKPVGTIIR